MQARVLTGGDRRPAGEPHPPRAVEKAGKVDAEERSRNQPDVRQRRVAAADVGWVQEYPAEPPLRRILLQRGVGVGDGHEVLARPVPLRRAHPLPEEAEERVRLGGRARLGRDQVERARRIAPRRGAADRGRVGGVEHRDVRRAACDAEGPAEHLGGERRAAHAADERALEAVAARLGGERLQLGDARLHPLDQREPPEAVRDLRLVLGVVRLPQGGVLLPEPRAHPRLVHLPDGCRHPAGGAPQRDAAAFAHQHRLAPRRHRREQRVVRLGERRHPFDLEPLRHGLHADAHLREPLEDALRLLDAPLEARLGMPVVLVGGERGRGHGVDGVRRDERLDVVRVGVGRVLGRGARPERPLDARARAGQRGEALAAELAAEGGVGELGVGDRGLAPERLEQRRCLAAAGPELLVDQPVDRRVHAAHEEARHRGVPVDPFARGEPPVEAPEVRLHHRVVAREREDERDVDVQPVGDRLLDRGDAGARAGNLDHQVRAVDGSPEPVRLPHSRLGVVREARRHLEADEAVAAGRPLEDGQEEVGGLAEVADGERLEDLLGRLALGGQRAQLVVVVRARGDGLLEDGGIGREAGDVAVGDHAGEPSGHEQRAVDVVVPRRLAELLQLDERARRGCYRRLLPRLIPHLGPPHPILLTWTAGRARAR